MLQQRTCSICSSTNWLKASGGEATDSSDPENPAWPRNSSRVRPSLSRNLRACSDVITFGHHAAPGADAKSRRLLRGEDDNSMEPVA